MAYFGQRVLAAYPEFTEKVFSRLIFRWLSAPFIWLTSRIPFSLTEILAICSPVLLVLLVYWIARMIKGPARGALFGRSIRFLAWTASCLYLAFMLLHGFNYARMPAAESFSLPVRERSAAELAQTAEWLAELASEIRETRLEDDLGVFKLESGVKETLKTAYDGYEAVTENSDLLQGAQIRPKGVMLSYYWSYTGITGMYFPFLVESNVNIDVPHSQIPDTALHEIAHTRGFAREDEANFLAFYTGIHHPDPDFAYSVILNTTVRCLNSLYSADREKYDRAASLLSEAVWRDLQARNEYWKQFAGPVKEASSQINNAYLQANLQEDGVRSYGRMIDLVLAWHEKMADEGRLENIAGQILDRANSK